MAKNTGRITDKMWADFEEMIDTFCDLAPNHPDGWIGIRAQIEERMNAEETSPNVEEFFSWFGYQTDDEFEDDEDSDDDDSDLDFRDEDLDDDDTDLHHNKDIGGEG